MVVSSNVKPGILQRKDAVSELGFINSFGDRWKIQTAVSSPQRQARASAGGGSLRVTAAPDRHEAAPTSFDCRPVTLGWSYSSSTAPVVPGFGFQGPCWEHSSVLAAAGGYLHDIKAGAFSPSVLAGNGKKLGTDRARTVVPDWSQTDLRDIRCRDVTRKRSVVEEEEGGGTFMVTAFVLPRTRFAQEMVNRLLSGLCD